MDEQQKEQRPKEGDRPDPQGPAGEGPGGGAGITGPAEGALHGGGDIDEEPSGPAPDGSAAPTQPL